MPTMLRLKSVNFDRAALILNRVRAEGVIPDADLQILIDLMNRSIVGVSKLLHFVNPQKFAIWDSRVATYLYPGLSYYAFQRIRTYRTYLQTSHEIGAHSDFVPTHHSINQKIGRQVSALRAIELIMYINGG
jgi:hypothetical protein